MKENKTDRNNTPRLSVVLRENAPDVVPLDVPPTADSEAVRFYEKALESCSAEKIKTVYFKNFPLNTSGNGNFHDVYIVEKCIMDFLYSNEYPESVQIVCDSEQASDLYKMVYNFFYAVEKSDRLTDDKWD